MLDMLAPNESLDTRCVSQASHLLKVLLNSLRRHHLVLFGVDVQARHISISHQERIQLCHERMHLREEIDAKHGGHAGIDDVGEGEASSGCEPRNTITYRDGEK